VKPVAAAAPKFKTLSKYSYAETEKYCKVELSELVGLTDEKVEVDFQNRSLSLKVFDYKGLNYQFTVPKLQCKILPKDCSYLIKKNCL